MCFFIYICSKTLLFLLSLYLSFLYLFLLPNIHETSLIPFPPLSSLLPFLRYLIQTRNSPLQNLSHAVVLRRGWLSWKRKKGTNSLIHNPRSHCIRLQEKTQSLKYSVCSSLAFTVWRREEECWLLETPQTLKYSVWASLANDLAKRKKECDERWTEWQEGRWCEGSIKRKSQSYYLR